MKHNKAPCHSDFSAEFHQTFRDFIKDDVMAHLQNFIKQDCHYSFNFGVIPLLLKGLEATKIQHCRPIFLLNVSSINFFMKVGMNRLTSIAVKVIWPSQVPYYLIVIL